MIVNFLLVLSNIWAVLAHSHVVRHRAYFALAVLIVLDLAYLLLFGASQDRDLWAVWMREDGWVEWSTVTAFTAATALFTWRAVRGSGWGRFACAGLALFCFFVAGEELSWGQRIFMFEPPELFLKENYQQETNLHNLLNDKQVGGFKLDSRFLVAVICIVYGIVSPILGAIAKRKGWMTGLWPPAVLVPSFALIAAVELDYPVDLAGEAAEWMLGMTFLADALLRGDLPKKMLGLLPVTVALGLVIAPTLDAVVFGSDEERVAKSEAELEQLVADMDEGAEQKLREKTGRVHKRVYTAVTSGYMAFEDGSTFLEGQVSAAEDGERGDRKGYFLDPWNNAYWILWDPKNDVWILYSFGPNRRRDILTKPFEAVAGDDIVRVIAAP
jgi:hypothetical protein